LSAVISPVISAIISGAKNKSQNFSARKWLRGKYLARVA
jgi:hypothetical protein